MSQGTPAISPLGTRIVISGDDIPFSAYQAIYHKITKKSERRERTFRGAFTISYEDIKDLHLRLDQITKQYRVVSKRCQISHQLSGDTSRDHSSFEKFSLADYSTRSPTNAINYELDFLIVLPPEIPEAAEVAQRFTINVVIDQDIQLLDSPRAAYFNEEVLFKNVLLNIEFSDFSVSQAIEATVEAWVEKLPKRVPVAWLRRLQNADQFARLELAQVVRFMVYALAAMKALKTGYFQEGVALILFALAFAQLMSTTIHVLMLRFHKYIGMVRPFTYLLLTQGDRDRQSMMLNRKKRAAALSSFVAFGIMGAIVLGLCTNYIYDVLKTRV